MIALSLLAALLGLASFYDLRDGQIPLLLLMAIPISGAVHIAVSPGATEWLWRALSAIGMMMAAAIAGACSAALRQKFGAGAKPPGMGLGAADILLIGGGALWLEPGCAALPGLFLLLSGVAGLLWAAFWRNILATGWPGPETAFPMAPAISLVLLGLAAYGVFFPRD